MAVRDLPKVEAPVRFRYPAQLAKINENSTRYFRVPGTVFVQLSIFTTPLGLILANIPDVGTPPPLAGATLEPPGGRRYFDDVRRRLCFLRRRRLGDNCPRLRRGLAGVFWRRRAAGAGAAAQIKNQDKTQKWKVACPTHPCARL